MPRFELAAGAGAAPPRHRRALRLRLPDPAQARPRRRSTARRAPTIDFTDLHAWCEVYLPGAGWIGLDPTSGLLTGESHIPLAATPHYRNAAPISGYRELRQCRVRLRHDASTRVAEHPRITKPFSDESWEALDALGHKVDAALAGRRRAPDHGRRADLRVDRRFREPASGTPTPSARPSASMADALIRRLRERFAPGGFLHYGQGKWYPGETLPRWTFSLYWRARRQAGLARPRADRRRKASTTAATAERRRQAARRRSPANLGLDAETGRRGLRGPGRVAAQGRQAARQCRSGQFRSSTTPRSAAAWRSVFERGLTKPTRLRAAGAALERQAQPASAGARRSGRRGAAGCSWSPGDCPVGYRLPLGSLPHVPPTALSVRRADSDPHGAARSSAGVRCQPVASATTVPLQNPAQRAASFTADRTGQQDRVEQVLGEIDGAVRTAMTVEPRDGRLCVFMPPVEALEDYLELVAAAENAAQAIGLPVHIEGYAPPHDPRLNVIRVAPDPGVIEVNIHPAVELARMRRDHRRRSTRRRAQSRLGADKFMIDGRHTGTGGGNHVVVGGATPDDSPFLRRPDLLKSLVLHWQRHPVAVLPVLRPVHRPDQPGAAHRRGAARQPLRTRDRPGADADAGARATPPLPWLVDRLFRNLLVDVTGNTHRSEICIDKLYSPDGPTGRLGLVEFRGFEMPPNARMSLAQQLLVRALIARFWKTPARRPLRRAGAPRCTTASCCRIIVWPDFLDVLARSRASTASTFRPEWFEAQLEFRFPFCGEVEYEGVQAGAAPGAGALARAWANRAPSAAPCASSIPRSNGCRSSSKALNPERYAVTCNGRRGAADAAPDDRGRRGRRRALQGLAAGRRACIRCCRSTRRWPSTSTTAGRQRSIGGCVYHVAHPGGRNYETFPVNGNEAEARRLARFEPAGHTPGGYRRLRQEQPSGEFPLTLDLQAAGRASDRSWRGGSEIRRQAQAADGRLLDAATARSPGVPDEMVDADGAPRPAVAATSSPRSKRIGPEELPTRFARADQYLRDAGVFYRVYDGAGGNERDWPLAHVPLLIDEDEWAHISAGPDRSAPTCSNDRRRHLWRQQAGRRRAAAARTDRRATREFLRPLVGVKPRERPFPAFLRLRARARAGWRLVGARRPHAGAVRRRLRAREPRRHDARAVRHLCARCTSTGSPASSAHFRDALNGHGRRARTAASAS